MEIRIAKSAGFCFGVKRALKLVAMLTAEGGNIQTYGELIHNPAVLRDLAARGVRPVYDFREIDPAGVLVIRSHGIGREIEARLRAEKISFVDATCPFVKKIHRLVSNLSEQGKRIVIAGDRRHPEIVGIQSYFNREGTIINSMAELEKLSPAREMSILAQTTLDRGFYRRLVSRLLEKTDKLEVYNTICAATEIRQQEVRRLASEVDALIVVGGKNSSNTRKLYKIARRFNQRAYYLESSRDLSRVSWLDEIIDCHSIGIHGGASTPPREIERVAEYLADIYEQRR